MSIDDQLQPGEEILYRAHITRISLIPWAVLLALVVAGGLFGWSVAPEPFVAFLAGALGLLLLGVIGVKLLVLRSSEHILTNRRVLQQVGILSKRSVTAPLDKVNNVEHWQTLWGRLLGYGDVEIDTASEHGATRFHNISRPLDFKGAIIAAAEEHRAGRMGMGIRPAAAAPSGAERMRELKALLDDGLISPQEFEVKRQQILQDL